MVHEPLTTATFDLKSNQHQTLVSSPQPQSSPQQDELSYPRQKFTLLDSLLISIYFLLDISVARSSIFSLSSTGCHKLLGARLRSIFTHGAKIKKYHLIFSQSSFESFDIWLEDSIVDFSLVKYLQKHGARIQVFYYEWAFLADPQFYEILLKSLNLLSTRDYDHFYNFQASSKLFQAHNPSIIASSLKKEIEAICSSQNQIHDSSMSQTPNKPIDIAQKRDSLTPQSFQDEGEDDLEPLLKGNTLPPEFSYSYGSPISPIAQTPASISALETSFLQKSTPSNPTQSQGETGTEDEETPVKKSFLESDGRIRPPAFGNFPLPKRGQSLTSFLIDSLLSDRMGELDRENAHFNVSEAIISAFERLKLEQNRRVSSQNEVSSRSTSKVKSSKSLGQPQPGTSSGERVPFKSSRILPPLPPKVLFGRPSVMHTETEESEFEYWRQPRKPPSHLLKKRKPKQAGTRNTLGSDGQSASAEDSILLSTSKEMNSSGSNSHSTSSISSEDESIPPENGSVDLPEPVSGYFSAENVALNLLRRNVKSTQLLPTASELQWLCSDSDTPQSLLPLPKSYSFSDEANSETDSGKISMAPRLRGTYSWAPPRPVIILTLHPYTSMRTCLQLQNYKCAGCGMRVEIRFSNTFRYCHYLGRYFCTGCHTLKKARIPQFILHKWDFSLYTVSNFSATLLDSLKSDPVYFVLSINPDLFRRVVKMGNFRKYRTQLGYLKEYLENCRGAEDLTKELTSFPTYFYLREEVDLYSLDDLVNVRFGTGTAPKLKEFVRRGMTHVLNCTLCKELGFNCEVCRKDQVLFPFQVNTVSRCPRCGSCFHIKCFSPPPSTNMTDKERARFDHSRVKNCPKCLRLAGRRREAAEGVEGEINEFNTNVTSHESIAV